MTIWHTLRALWFNVTDRKRAELELEAELRAYADLLADEKIESGMAPAAAHRAAMAELGGIEHVKDNVKEVRVGASLETTAKDIRYGVRALLRTPGFTLTSIIALGLGIGASTTVFSVVNAVLLRPLPYADPDQLVVVLHQGKKPAAAANYLDW